VKPCRVCAHPEVGFISKLLRQGLSPRALCKRIGGTTRRSLTHHRESCLKERNEA
jgi:hypothetical protein